MTISAQTQLVQKRGGIISITCVTSIVALSLIALSTAIALIVSITYALSAADDFATSYSRTSAITAAINVNEFTSIPVNVFAQMRISPQMGLLPNFVINSTGALEPLMEWARSFQPMLFSSEFTLPYISMGYEDGTLIDCHTDDVTTFATGCFISNRNNQSSRALLNSGYAILTSYLNDAYLGEQRFPFEFTPLVRPWYINAPKTRDANPVFTKPYIEYQTAKMVTDVTGPIYHSDGTFLGVSSISLDLKRISTFLSELPKTENTMTILVDGDGYLLGASDLTPILNTFDAATPELLATPGCEQDPNSNMVLCRISPANHDHRALRELAKKEQSIFANDGASFTRKIKLGGDQWMISKSPISAKTPVVTAGIDWQIITLMPVTDVTNPIIEGRDIAIIVAVITIVVFCAICAGLLFVTLRPLIQLSECMEQAAELKDDSLGATMDKSSMREIRAIQDSFERLSAQLKKAKSFLPASLLAQLEFFEEDDEDEEGDGYVGNNEDLLRSGASTEDQSENSHSQTCTNSTIGTEKTPTVVGRVGRPSHMIKGKQYSDAKSSRSNNHNNGNNMTIHRQLDTNVGLAARGVSVAVINFRHFHESMLNTAVPLQSEYGRLIDQFQAIAKEHKGILDSFHGDKFHFTFNAVRMCATHATSAASTCLKISALVHQNNGANANGSASHRVSRITNHIATDVTCGVATGRCLVGNLGSDKAKRYTVIGPAFTHATVLERLCKRYPNTTVLLSSETAAECETSINLLFVDFIACVSSSHHNSNGKSQPTVKDAPINPMPSNESGGLVNFSRFFSGSNNNNINNNKDQTLNTASSASHLSNANIKKALIASAKGFKEVCGLNDEWMYEMQAMEAVKHGHHTTKAIPISSNTNNATGKIKAKKSQSVEMVKDPAVLATVDISNNNNHITNNNNSNTFTAEGNMINVDAGVGSPLSFADSHQGIGGGTTNVMGFNSISSGPGYNYHAINCAFKAAILGDIEAVKGQFAIAFPNSLSTTAPSPQATSPQALSFSNNAAAPQHRHPNAVNANEVGSGAVAVLGANGQLSTSVSSPTGQQSASLFISNHPAVGLTELLSSGGEEDTLGMHVFPAVQNGQGPLQQKHQAFLPPVNPQEVEVQCIKRRIEELMVDLQPTDLGRFYNQCIIKK